MFDIGWSEMLLMVVIAIVVVGPKELPTLMRTVGRWIAKAKQMSREFQHNLEIVADEAQLKDIQKDLKADLKTIQDTGKSLLNEQVSTEPTGKTPPTAPDTEKS